MHEILSLKRTLSVEVIYFSCDCEKAFLQSWERSVFPFAVSITPKRLRLKKKQRTRPHYEKKRKIPPAYLYSTTGARTVKETTLLLSSLRNKESVVSHLFYVSVMSLFGQSRDSLKEHIGEHNEFE